MIEECIVRVSEPLKPSKDRMDVQEVGSVNDFDGTDHLDNIARRLVEVLGDAQKEFEGGVFTDKLGSKFGGYGSFLPTELRGPSVLAQTNSASAMPTLSNPMDKISSAFVGEQKKRVEISASLTDAGRGGTTAVEKVLLGQKISASVHAVNSDFRLNGRDEDIRLSVRHGRNGAVTEEFKYTEINNANHFLSTSDRVATAIDMPFENTISRGIAPTIGDTSSKTQNYGGDRGLDKMESRRPMVASSRRNPEDSRRKNKPIYSGLGLNDSSSFSLEEDDDETYLSDAYSSPGLSPLTMIQVVMSRLQSKYHLVLSPLCDVFGSPTDANNKFVGLLKDSEVLPCAVQSNLDSEDCLHNSESPTGREVCEVRNRKQNILANSKIKMTELKSTRGDEVHNAVLQTEKTKIIKEVNADSNTRLHYPRKEIEAIKHEAIKKAKKHSGLTRDATETSVHKLDPSNQEIAKELNVSEVPVTASRKEKGKLKPTGRAISCGQIDEQNESQALEISVTYPRNKNGTSLLVPEKKVQAFTQCKEKCNASREASFFQKEGSSSHFHEHGTGKVDSTVRDEFERDSKPGKSEKDVKGYNERKNASPILGSASPSKDVISNGKRDMIKKVSLKGPEEKMVKDASQVRDLSKDTLNPRGSSQVREFSKDTLTIPDKKREGKKDLQKVATESVFALDKNAKGMVNVATREHEHVTTSSEYFEKGIINMGRNLNDNKLATKEFKATLDSGKGGKHIKESGARSMGVILVEKNSVEASNRDRLNPNASMSEPVLAASAPVPTLVLDNWVMCDKCGQWRLLLPEIDVNKLPKKFFCKMMTWLPGMNSCKYKEDETSSAVYAYLGIPNPNFPQLNTSVAQPVPVSVPSGSLTSAPLVSLNVSAVTEKIQDTKRTTPFDDNRLDVKVAPVLSKSSSFSRKGDCWSMKNKNVNDVDHAVQDLDTTRQGLWPHDGAENKFSLLKTKRNQAKTNSVEQLEILLPVERMKVAETGTSCFSKTEVVSLLPRESVAKNQNIGKNDFHKKSDAPGNCVSKTPGYFKESTQIENSANTGKPPKESFFDEGATESRRTYQSRALEEQINHGSTVNAGGVNSKQHSSKSGEAKLDRKLKVRLRRNEDIQKDGKRLFEENVSNSQILNGKKMKSTDSDRGNSSQIKGKLGTRPPGILGKDYSPKDGLDDQEQLKRVNEHDPEGFTRGTFSKPDDAHNESAAQKLRKRQSMSSSPLSSPSPVSSPESSTRKSKGKKRLQLQESDPLFPGDVGEVRSAPSRGMNKVRAHGATNAVLEGSLNSDNEDYEQEDSEEQHRVFPRALETSSYDNHMYHKGRGLKHAHDQKLRERDRRTRPYDRSNDPIKERDLKMESGCYGKNFEKWMPGPECDGWEEKFTRREKSQDAQARNPWDETNSDIQLGIDLHDQKDGIKAGSIDRSTSLAQMERLRLEGKERLNSITHDIKQESRVWREDSGEKYLQFEQERGLRTANGKCSLESRENRGSLNYKEGKISSERSSLEKLSARTGTKESEPMVIRNVDEPLLLSKSDARIGMGLDNGTSYSKTKPKNHTDLVHGESLAQGKELSKGTDEGPGSRKNSLKVSLANGHMVRGTDVGVASSLKGQPVHQAGILIKEAKSLKHTADRLEGSEAIRGDIYLHAALKFLQGAAIWETSQDGGAKHDILSLYNGTAKLCEFCATFYAKDVKSAALALKCAAVARMRAMQVKNSSTTRTLTELQAMMQLANPSPLGESPSSSAASDVDNLNNQTLPDEKLQGTSTVKELSSPLQASLSSIPASSRYHRQFTRFLQDAGEMCTAFEAWRRADHAIAAARALCSDALPEDAIRRVGEINFSDVETLVCLVNSALEAIRP